jgi:chromosome segregation ATPase
MLNVYHFLGILVPVLGIFVTLIIALLKFSRNSATKGDLRSFKEDLNNNIEELRSYIDRRFDEVDRQFDEVDRRFDEVDRQFDEVDRRFGEVGRRFDEAAADRESIRAEAAADREKVRNEARDQWKDIKTEMSEKFNLAHVERQKINGEIIRQNQNYIEHLAHHNTQRPKPASEDTDST